ncbi:MAG: hypothetical protein K2K63_10240 [Acetatifactor sp.]|nr:hypothetical protein [Acetatifactor sp.]
METIEIVLLAAGGIIFILSFLIPEKKGEASEQSKELLKEEIADMVSREMESVRGQVDGVVEEAVTYAMEKTERSLERLSNEKIMAVNEYSDTVLAEIHKNHEEAMFLYDMLNSKHDNLKNTVSTVNRTVKEVEEKLSHLQEMTGISRVSQARIAAEKTGEHGVVQPVRLQEFHPAASSNAAFNPGRTVPSVSVPAMSAPSVSAKSMSAPSASPSSAAVSAGRAAAPGRVPDTGRKMSTTAQASMPLNSMPAASMSATSMSAPSMARSSVPADMSAAGRVSFLQEKAGGQNNNERILELHRQGKSKVAIAKELGLGVGEVKLVIDLFRNQ